MFLWPTVNSGLKVICGPHWRQETQQGWQISAVVVVARSLSMIVIFCLLTTSSISGDFKQRKWLKFSLYVTSLTFFSKHQIWELWIQFSCLTLSLNKSCIARIPLLYFCHWQYLRIAMQISDQFVWKPEHTNPWRRSQDIYFNAKWPVKVIQGHLFWCQWKANYNNISGIACESSEDIASKRSTSYHFRYAGSWPHWRQETQQGWQISAVVVVARLLSMIVIFCLLATSSIAYVTSLIFFSKQQIWELWIQFSCLTLFLHKSCIARN